MVETGDACRLDGIKVLVVDDHASSCDVLRRLLEHRGASVRTAQSARDALALFEADLPQTLITDLKMAEEDGFTLMREIRARPPERGGKVPAIALTALSGNSIKEIVFSSGFQIFLTKPVLAKELYAAIDGLVAGR